MKHYLKAYGLGNAVKLGEENDRANESANHKGVCRAVPVYNWIFLEYLYGYFIEEDTGIKTVISKDKK